MAGNEIRCLALAGAWLLATAGLGRSAPPDHGFIRIDSKHPCTFVYDDGTRFFPMGDTCYDLLTADQPTIVTYIDSRSEHSFNFIRVSAIWPGFWPFGGTPERPDYATVSETALQKLDWVFTYAASQNVNLELILWAAPGVEGGEGMWGDQVKEDFWIDTLARRYKDRRNLFLFTVANEFERYPTGKYSYDPSDVEWAKRVAARLRQIDPVHPIGVHPSVWITNGSLKDAGWSSYRGFTQRRPQVVWPLWEGSSVDVNLVQNNQGVHGWSWRKGVNYAPVTWRGVHYPVTWTSTGWDFEGAGLEDSTAEDRAHGKPVINLEFGYQYDTGPVDDVDRQLHQQGTTRIKAWKIATAGGFFAAGFKHRLVNLGNYRWEQMEALYRFFTTRTEYWLMAPRLDLVSPGNVCLALPGKEYVIYLSRGGTDSIRLEPGTYRVEWLNPRKGEYATGDSVTGGAARSFTAVDRNDWVLHLRK